VDQERVHTLTVFRKSLLKLGDNFGSQFGGAPPFGNNVVAYCEKLCGFAVCAIQQFTDRSNTRAASLLAPPTSPAL
jgi:hypothetical protein